MKFLRDMIKQKADAVHAPPSGFVDNTALQLQDWRVEPDDAPTEEAPTSEWPLQDLDQQRSEDDATQQNVAALLETELQEPLVDSWQSDNEAAMPVSNALQPAGDDIDPPEPDNAFNMFAPDDEQLDSQPQISPPPEPTLDSFVVSGRGPARAGRVKTRILGFSAGMAAGTDPFGTAPNQAFETQPGFPVAWLVITQGPGRGTAFTLYPGVAQIGRGEGQTVRLDFGDTAISRENHAAIAYDAEQNSFFIGHGGKANIVRCNNRPVLSTQELEPGDSIRIGETTLRFVPLCGPGFHWNDSDTPESTHVGRG